MTRQRNIGNLYVTDAHWPSPYFEIPSFYGDQRAYLRRSGCA
jgi:hypothetical protein